MSYPGHSSKRELQLLHAGDRMRQKEFHRAYEQMPEDYRAELIGGIVFEPSPVSWCHGEPHAVLGALLYMYSAATQGVEVASNATVILGEEDELQPDVTMRLTEDAGGRSRLTRKGKYVKGPPELVAEIAYSSRAIDLHLKKDRYALGGVIEYIVLSIKPKRIYWFNLKHNRELKPDSTGVLRSKVFPGLWIHSEGLLHRERDILDETLKQGLTSPEHSNFVKSLPSR